MSQEWDLGDYVDVATRIGEFRQAYPNGSLRPLNPDRPYTVETIGEYTFIVVVAAAYRGPHDKAPGVGMAMEPFPGRTAYTRGSELQNAETSAWGRAIVAVGAADTRRGVASADEVAARAADREAEPEPWTAVGGFDAKDKVRRKLHALFTAAGYRKREDRLAFAAALVGRELATSKDLTAAELDLVITALEQGTGEDKWPDVAPLPT